ncbi:hypothetical protein TcWFU_009838 [Taenia crassiceps]|uniref:Uncharacterized protein n=1 Tax=Taenia crassiceps TaxID=6207 RepID=A0ABR4Q4J7_9CEST
MTEAACNVSLRPSRALGAQLLPPMAIDTDSGTEGTVWHQTTHFGCLIPTHRDGTNVPSVQSAALSLEITSDMRVHEVELVGGPSRAGGEMSAWLVMSR